jgi:hypothetical protein
VMSPGKVRKSYYKMRVTNEMEIDAASPLEYFIVSNYAP